MDQVHTKNPSFAIYKQIQIVPRIIKEKWQRINREHKYGHSGLEICTQCKKPSKENGGLVYCFQSFIANFLVTWNSRINGCVAWCISGENGPLMHINIAADVSSLYVWLLKILDERLWKTGNNRPFSLWTITSWH